MKDLRIALFTGNYNHIRDGVSLTLNRLVKYLEEHGVIVQVFGPSIEEPQLDHNGDLNVMPSIPIFAAGRKEYRITYSFPKNEREKLENFKPDIVHIATPDILGYKALKWAKKNEIPIVASYHTHFTSYFQYYKIGFLENLAWKYFRWFYNNCEHIYVPSQSMIDELSEVGLPKEKMKIWARGININLFNPRKRSQQFRAKAGFGEEDIVVTFVSRLVWEKELKTFIESVQNVSKINPKVKGMIVGDGPAQKEAEKMMPEGYFAGFMKGEELATAYASSDIFNFPSHTETFGNVTLEAMASGVPCLVADAIGSKSLVHNGINGYWAEKENVQDFTNKLEKMCSDEAKLKQMGKKSRELALSYEWDKINAQLIENYKEVLHK